MELPLRHHQSSPLSRLLLSSPFWNLDLSRLLLPPSVGLSLAFPGKKSLILYVGGIGR